MGKCGPMVGVMTVGSIVTILRVVRDGVGPSRSRGPDRGNSKSDAGQTISENSRNYGLMRTNLRWV